MSVNAVLKTTLWFYTKIVKGDKILNSSIKSLKRLELTEGILLIILGMLFAIFPGFWASFISILFGGLIFAIGATMVVNSILERKYRDIPLFKLTAGIIMSILGLVFIFYNSVPISIFAIVVGIVALVFGAVRITTAVFKKRSSEHWIWTFIEGTINSAFGIFMIINPLTGVDVWIIALGLYLIYIGVCFIIMVRKSEFNIINKN